MKNIKNKLNKGFTLIELMVVISIISLLSSIVLASVKEVRERAMITKTVSELKSLQTAIQMYKNEFGVYPPIQGKDGDPFGKSYISNNNFTSLVKTNLVDNKFLSNTIKSPRDCTSAANSCYTNEGYIIGYVSPSSGMPPYMPPAVYSVCGNDYVKAGVIFFVANSKKIDLPMLQYTINSGTTFSKLIVFSGAVGAAPYVYCLPIE